MGNEKSPESFRSPGSNPMLGPVLRALVECSEFLGTSLILDRRDRISVPSEHRLHADTRSAPTAQGLP